jgi:hypothetical protein
MIGFPHVAQKYQARVMLSAVAKHSSLSDRGVNICIGLDSGGK